VRTLEAGTLAKNTGASCLVPALALQLCTESQPGNCSQCQTAPEKQSYFQPGPVPWAGSEQPPAQPCQHRGGSGGRTGTSGPGRGGQQHLFSVCRCPWHGWVSGSPLPKECGGTGYLPPHCNALVSPASPHSARDACGEGGFGQKCGEATL